MFVTPSERSKILRLGLPVVATICSGPLMGIIDVAMVGPLGTASVAAIGISTFVMFATVGALWGALPVVQSLVAREVGKNLSQPGEAVACIAMIICGVLSLGIGLALYFLATPIAALLAANDEIATELTRYLTIMAFCAPTNAVAIAIDGLWQGRGETNKVMACTLLGQLLNIPLSIVFIYGHMGFEPMGIEGAALGSTLAFWIAALVRLLWQRLRLSSISQRNSANTVTLLLRRGSANSGADLVISIGWTASMWLTGLMGAEAQAISAVVVQLAVFSMVIAHGYGIAGGSLIGWSLAQDNHAEARRWGWAVGQVAVMSVLPIALLFLFWGATVMDVVVDDAALISGGATVLTVLALGLMIDSLGVVLVRGMQVAGATAIAAPVQIASMLMFLPLAWFIGVYLDYGVVGFWVGFVISRVGNTLIACAAWQSGWWLRYSDSLDGSSAA